MQRPPFAALLAAAAAVSLSACPDDNGGAPDAADVAPDSAPDVDRRRAG